MVVGALAATMATVTSCAGTPADDGPRSLTIAVPGVASHNWDPVTGGALIFGLVTPGETAYESLIVLDATELRYEPWLAEEYMLSEDRRTMSVTLHDDVDFTDGEHLTAEAYKAGFDAIMAGGSNYSTFELVSFEPEVVVTGDYTFDIQTTRGINERFFDALTYLPVVSPAALDDLEALAATAAGTGPYIVDELVPDVSTTFIRNPNYWNPDAYDFDTVTYLAYPDRIAAANALKSGQVDAAQLDLGLAEDVENSGLTIQMGGGEVATFVWLDRKNELGSPVADVRVRQAISYAFDRDSINENLNLGYGVARSQAFLKGTPQYIEGGDDRYPYDLEKARELMTEAGYPDGFDLALPVYSQLAIYQPMVEQSLADIGIRVTFDEYADAGAWAATYMEAPLRYPIIFRWQGDAGWLAYLSDNGIYNQRGPADPITAALFDRMDNGTPEVSAAAAQELGELLLEEAWYIPVSRRFDLWGSAPDVAIAVGNKAAWPVGLRDFSAVD
jgi:peptide/nickel transport system substrate-binding protein